MHSLLETLILRGLVPIGRLSPLSVDPGLEEREIAELLTEGVLTASQVASAKAAVAGVPFVELLDYPIDRAAVSLVPAEMCRRHEILPLSVGNGELVIAMVDPGDVFALDDVRAVTRLRTHAVAAEASDLLAAMNRYIRADSELTTLKDALTGVTTPLSTTFVSEMDSFDDAPIVRFVNLIIGQGIHDKASDIHIEPGESTLRVRYRIDGVLHAMHSAPKAIQNGVISRVKIMSDIDISEHRKPQDGRMTVSHGGRKIDLRVATLPTVFGEKIVLRILDSANAGLAIEDLGMLDRNFDAYRRSYSKPYGMILVTGPTGSGKSTTLYTTLSAVATPEINVITVEDPVEMQIDGINQVQVNVKAGLTFASALRSILRSDPDVVLLGEIRDFETAQIAIQASLTGHLVLSTLHTNDAPSAITRLTEMGIEPFLVGSALECVVAQRLARRLCNRCKIAVRYSPGDLMNLGIGHDGGSAVPPLFAAVGCPACFNTGYAGRIALHEVMMVTEEIEKLTVARASSADIGRLARSQGMVTMRADGWTKACLGLISVEEIIRVVA